MDPFISDYVSSNISLFVFAFNQEDENEIQKISILFEKFSSIKSPPKLKYYSKMLLVQSSTYQVSSLSFSPNLNRYSMIILSTLFTTFQILKKKDLAFQQDLEENMLPPSQKAPLSIKNAQKLQIWISSLKNLFSPFIIDCLLLISRSPEDLLSNQTLSVISYSLFVRNMNRPNILSYLAPLYNDVFSDYFMFNHAALRACSFLFFSHK